MHPDYTMDLDDNLQPAASPAGNLIPAVLNAVAVVNYLNRAKAVTVPELARSLAFTPSHCRSILRTLMQVGWVHRDERTNAYTLSPGIAASASSVVGANDSEAAPAG